VIQDVWEGVGAHEGGLITDDELVALERDACPGYGACTGHFTANTMAVAIDFLGLGPIGLGSVPAADPAKAEAGEAAGRLVLDVIERDVRPSSLVTRAGLENAIVGVTGPTARRTQCCICWRSRTKPASRSSSKTSIASRPRPRL
jgi:dihydroxy-acid dehydratase